MDELNVHQFWGISPYLDLLAAAAAVNPSTGHSTAPAAILQICPYDCRHTLATISHHVSKLQATTIGRAADATTPDAETAGEATAGVIGPGGETADTATANAGTAAGATAAAAADAAVGDAGTAAAAVGDAGTAAAAAGDAETAHAAAGDAGTTAAATGNARTAAEATFHAATAGKSAADAATAADAGAPDAATANAATGHAAPPAPITALIALPACSSSSTSETSASHRPHLPQQQPQLQLYLYEAEPEVLARHMLLLSVLFDHGLTIRERAEMFLELHGNVSLRQKTADYLVAASKTLEEAVAQLSICSAPAAAASKPQQQQAALGVLQVFDLSLLKYQERDALLEIFQRYRQKASFDMYKAWDDRCRKWYADRYDFRDNLIDWDYHMRLTPRGTPFLDPALGSIIHFYHFRHWRLTGVAHELRGSSCVSANTSLLSTAYGRTKEFKDRQLRDVGRSVSALGYWGDVLNSPYHCLGTVADEPGLFKVSNKQFMHTAVDVAEHNILGFMQQIRAGCQPQDAAAATKDSSSSAIHEAHRANAARGPTSMELLTGTSACDSAVVDGEDSGSSSAAAAAAANGAGIDDEAPVAEAQHQPRDLALNGQRQQHLDKAQQQHQTADNFAKLQALETAITQVSIAQLVATTKLYLLCGDLKRSLTGKSKYAQHFIVATVGHRHVHLLSPEYGVAYVLQPRGLVLAESGQNMVQLNHEQVKAFEDKVVEIAAAGGFRRHRDLSAAGGSSSSEVVKEEQQKWNGHVWRVPPGHFALEVATAEQQF